MTAVYERIEHILRENPFFEDFDTDEIDFFAKQMSLRSFPEKAIIVQKEEHGSFLFFVVDGEVEVRLEGPDFKQIIVATLGRGACAGEMALIDDFPRSATVITAKPSELLLLTKNRLDSICAENPHLGLKFIKGLTKSLSMKLRQTTGQYAELA